MNAVALLLAAIATAPGAAATPADGPIAIVAQPRDGGVRLEVIGLAKAPYRARYALEVVGQGPGGTNRTSQGGAATLRPGERTVLLAIALNKGAAARWSATLTVTPAEGAPYRQQIASPPPGGGPS